MKNIFHKKLHKFVLVFFDDILIYSKTWKEHLHHLEEVLQILHDPCFLKNLSGQQIASANIESKYMSRMSWPSMCNIGVRAYRRARNLSYRQ